MAAAVAVDQPKTFRHVVRKDDGIVQEVETTIADDVIEEDFDKIPVIDVSGMFSDDIEERKKVGVTICEAAEKVGFMYFKNHNVPKETIDMIFSEAKRFFDQPVEKKMELFNDIVDENGVPNYEGYHPLGQYNRHHRKYNDWFEALNFSEDRKYDPVPQPKLEGDFTYVNKFPTDDDLALEKNVFKYHGAILTLGRKMAGVLALGLGLPENYFEEDLKYPMCGGRMLHYPTQIGTPEEQNGIGAHIDFSFLTFLLQDSTGGLQVMNKRGQWVKATPIEGTFVVNVGSILTRYTNGKLQGTIHKVCNTSGAERYSIPIFLYPARQAVIRAVPTCIKEGEKPLYEEMTVAECVDWHLTNVSKLKSK